MLVEPRARAGRTHQQHSRSHTIILCKRRCTVAVSMIILRRSIRVQSYILYHHVLVLYGTLYNGI